MKILSIHDLATIRKKAEHNLLLREESNEKVSEKCYGLSSGAQHLQILICGGTGCKASSSQGITDNLLKAIEKNGITGKVEVITVGCFGFCEKGPIVKIIPDNTFYTQVTPEDAEEIINEHIIGGRRIKRLLYVDPKTEHTVSDSKHMDFYRKQLRIALRNCGFIDPENIEEYIAREGYFALADCLLNKKPTDVIDIIKRSGLRGRGGGGFPTGLKWEFANKQQSDVKYVVCNADEGDPGAFMDCAVMEGIPHQMIEGMLIAAYAVQAHEGYIYVRAEYPLAVKRLKLAIAQAESMGLLGDNILGTGFSFHLHINRGAGAFVCGEGSALTASIEGKRGMPRVKPPRTVSQGLFAKPTVLNNVETYANVPMIIENGAHWYRSIGPENSPGTKTFSLSGTIRNTGLIEVPMGTKLGDVIFGIGGGIKNDQEFKAVQLGGPSGGCLTKENLDLSLDFDSLKKTGAIIGSGGMVVMDQHTCMVEVARFFMNFTQRESCGKCVPCREGTTRMLEILQRIVEGKGEPEDLDKLLVLADMISSTALCGLGKSAPLPVVSTIRAFRDEYMEHIVDKKCRAKVCDKLKTYVIDPQKCKGCSRCAKNCPVNAISGEIKSPFTIDNTKCVRCGVCMDHCSFDAIYID